jgi:hypothetical protein
MSNISSRLQQLEKKHGPKHPARIFVYFHDKEKGYAKSATGPYFATFDELKTAQGWQPSETDVTLSVEYASQIFIPDNGRDLQAQTPGEQTA